MAKPDDRSNNAKRIQSHIDNTTENLREAEDYLEEFSEELTREEKQNIEAKNKRRLESIKAFAAEKEDELEQ